MSADKAPFFCYYIIKLLCQRGKLPMFVKNPEYFLTIVKERSISKAAEKLYLSQPYLSQYLAKLESSVGVTLMDRSRTPLKLTPAGELFHAYLESQGYLDRQLKSDLQELQDREQRVVHIGVATWRGSILLPDVLPRYAQRHPDIQVVLHENPAPKLEELIADNVTDFCIMHIPGDTSELTYEMVMQERILLVGNRSHPLVAARAGEGEETPHFDIRLLEQETLIMLPPDWRMARILHNTFDIYNLKPRRTLLTTNNTTAVNLVAEGMGFTFLPESGLKRSNHLEQLAFFTVGDPPLSCPLAVVYKKNSFLSPAARDFIDLTRSCYNQKR